MFIHGLNRSFCVRIILSRFWFVFISMRFRMLVMSVNNFSRVHLVIVKYYLHIAHIMLKILLNCNSHLIGIGVSNSVLRNSKEGSWCLEVNIEIWIWNHIKFGWSLIFIEINISWSLNLELCQNWNFKCLFISVTWGLDRWNFHSQY